MIMLSINLEKATPHTLILLYYALKVDPQKFRQMEKVESEIVGRGLDIEHLTEGLPSKIAKCLENYRFTQSALNGKGDTLKKETE